MKNSKLGYILSGAAGGCAVLLLVCVFSFSSAEKAEQEPIVCQLKQCVESPEMPTSVIFAGEKMPLTRYDVRERFDREIATITYQHSYTLQSLKRANQFFPVIEPILAKHGIPNDFKYLALIESNFNIRALSGVKAAGFWQLMPETAKELGLEVTDSVDERYHVAKSTEAACAYLNKAYAVFGSWVLTAAAYNAGIGRIKNAVAAQQTKDFEDLWLNEETSRYVFRIFAMKEFLKQPQAYGYYIRKDQYYPMIRTKEVEVSTSIPDLAAFAKEHGVPYVQFKTFNLWLRGTKLENKSGKTYQILIPNKDDLEFDINKVKMYQENWAVE
jgi:hypothetical protein